MIRNKARAAPTSDSVPAGDSRTTRPQLRTTNSAVPRRITAATGSITTGSATRVTRMVSVPRHHRPPRIGDYIQKCRDSVVPPDTFLKGCPIVRQSGNGPPELLVGGRSKYFWRQWYAMGASRRVVRWLKNGYPLRFRRSMVQGNALPLCLYRPRPIWSHINETKPASRLCNKKFKTYSTRTASAR